MKETLERLWSEYLEEECAALDTERERELSRKAVQIHEEANALLDEEQKDAVEKYVDALCEIQSCFVKKAFFKGCEFSISFLLEAGSFGKG